MSLQNSFHSTGVVKDASFNNLNVNNSLTAGSITASLLRVNKLLANTLVGESIEVKSLSVNGVPITGENGSSGGGGANTGPTLPGIPNGIVTIDATGKLQVSGGGTLTSTGAFNLNNAAVGTGIQFGSQTVLGQNLDKTSLALGTGAGGITNAASINTSVGSNALNQVTSGTQHTAIGYQAATGVIANNASTVIGANTIAKDQSTVVVGTTTKSNGPENTYVGSGSGDSTNTTSLQNTYLGMDVGIPSAADNYDIQTNTFVGFQSGFGGNAGPGASTWSGNVAVGARCMRPSAPSTQVTCSNNTCIGNDSARSMVSDIVSDTVSDNVCVGSTADIASGKTQSVVIGSNTLDAGGSSVILGHATGAFDDVGSSDSVLIGRNIFMQQSTIPATGIVLAGANSLLVNNDGSDSRNVTGVGYAITLSNIDATNCILLGAGAKVAAPGTIGFGSLADGGPVGGSSGSIVVNIQGIGIRRIPYFV